MTVSGNSKLKILLLEDVLTDAELIEYELKKSHIDFLIYRVETEENFKIAIEKFQPDIILSDYSLPSFNGISALKIIQQRKLDLPFIFVTGAMGEELAIDTLKSGATDYVIKDKLSRLVPSVKRALREVEERKVRYQAEQSLKQSEERYRALYDDNPSMYFTVDSEGIVLSVNQFGAEQLGYTVEELVGKSVLNVFFEDDKKAVVEKLKNFLKHSDTIGHWEFRKVRKNGKVLWVKETVRSVKGTDGNPVLLIVCEDITEKKIADEKIKASLQEKDLMLQEIHHRVKNNLQVISSLLSLQAKQIDDITIKELFSQSQHRIRSMALVHEKLYQSNDFSRIDYAEYIKSLAKSLYRSYQINTSNIHFEVNTGNVFLSIDMAVPCGLVINELISNALKHAFPESFKGERVIRITLKKMNEDKIQLVVSDNGVGLPKQIDIRNTESLGLRLVTILVEDQLNGKVQVSAEKGTRFEVTFPLQQK